MIGLSTYMGIIPFIFPYNFLSIYLIIGLFVYYQSDNILKLIADYTYNTSISAKNRKSGIKVFLIDCIDYY